MVDVQVTGRDGSAHRLAVIEGSSLMEALREHGLGVEGICGGACACGTCHVYIAASWRERLPPRSEDEQLMLEGIGELVTVREDSRLACQITVGAALDGLQLEVGPVA